MSDYARARGAHIYGELAGYGATDDAYHITAPAEGGEGAVRSMRIALRKAGCNPEEIGYVNAHGTETVHNRPKVVGVAGHLLPPAQWLVESDLLPPARWLVQSPFQSRLPYRVVFFTAYIPLCVSPWQQVLGPWLAAPVPLLGLASGEEHHGHHSLRIPTPRLTGHCRKRRNLNLQVYSTRTLRRQPFRSASQS